MTTHNVLQKLKEQSKAEKKIMLGWKKQAAQAETSRLESELEKINSYSQDVFHYSCGYERREIILEELEKRNSL